MPGSVLSLSHSLSDASQRCWELCTVAYPHFTSKESGVGGFSNLPQAKQLVRKLVSGYRCICSLSCPPLDLPAPCLAHCALPHRNTSDWPVLPRWRPSISPCGVQWPKCGDLLVWLGMVLTPNGPLGWVVMYRVPSPASSFLLGFAVKLPSSLSPQQ